MPPRQTPYPRGQRVMVIDGAISCINVPISTIVDRYGRVGIIEDIGSPEDEDILYGIRFTNGRYMGFHHRSLIPLGEYDIIGQ